MSFDASVCVQCSQPALARARASSERWVRPTSCLCSRTVQRAQRSINRRKTTIMASVSGLLQVRVRQAKGLDAAPAAALTVRLRLLPWKEEQSSDTAQCDDDGTAEWALSDANLVVLPHLAAHDEAEPQLSIDLRSRELLVYERCLGITTIDAQPLLIPGEENEMWISLNEKTSVLLTTKFQPGTTTPSNIARTPSLVLNEAGRHQHLFRLQSYNAPQWCAVCERMMMGLRHQGFRCEACGLSVHGGCQLKAHAVFDCVGKKPPPLETPQPSFDEPLVRPRRPVRCLHSMRLVSTSR